MFGITEIGEQRRYHSKNLSEHLTSILGENKNRGQEPPSYLELKQRAEKIKIQPFNFYQLEKLLNKKKKDTSEGVTTPLRQSIDSVQCITSVSV